MFAQLVNSLLSLYACIQPGFLLDERNQEFQPLWGDAAPSYVRKGPCVLVHKRVVEIQACSQPIQRAPVEICKPLHASCHNLPCLQQPQKSLFTPISVGMLGVC